MHSRILFVSVLFSILFALAAIAAPQPDPLLVERSGGIFHLHFFKKEHVLINYSVPSAISNIPSGGNLQILTRFKNFPTHYYQSQVPQQRVLVSEKMFLKQLHVSHPPILTVQLLYLIQKIAVAGELVTVLTSKGGSAYTLASPGAGATTSVFGSVYTIATAVANASSLTGSSNSTSSSSSASVTHAGVQTSLLVGLGSMLASALLGMMMTL